MQRQNSGDLVSPVPSKLGGDVVGLTGQWETKGEMEVCTTLSAPLFQNGAWPILWAHGFR